MTMDIHEVKLRCLEIVFDNHYCSSDSSIADVVKKANELSNFVLGQVSGVDIFIAQTFEEAEKMHKKLHNIKDELNGKERSERIQE